MQRVAENLRAINPERVGPPLYLGGIFVGYSKAQHRHTGKTSPYDMQSDAIQGPAHVERRLPVQARAPRDQAPAQGADNRNALRPNPDGRRYMRPLNSRLSPCVHPDDD